MNKSPEQPQQSHARIGSGVDSVTSVDEYQPDLSAFYNRLFAIMGLTPHPELPITHNPVLNQSSETTIDQTTQWLVEYAAAQNLDKWYESMQRGHVGGPGPAELTATQVVTNTTEGEKPDACRFARIDTKTGYTPPCAQPPSKTRGVQEDEGSETRGVQEDEGYEFFYPNMPKILPKGLAEEADKWGLIGLGCCSIGHILVALAFFGALAGCKMCKEIRDGYLDGLDYLSGMIIALIKALIKALVRASKSIAKIAK
ncbi:MAG: hypothetical protein GF390_02150 [Candidatus Pacebacteria bacterium]|nr:hypothetical protein [Candidatus Paceibacterota bacterium]